jgi:flagellar capping protein FliD
MDESIISSAKKIILDQKSQNDHDNDDKIEKLEEKLRNMEKLMLSMNEKLTKLIAA